MIRAIVLALVTVVGPIAPTRAFAQPVGDPPGDEPDLGDPSPGPTPPPDDPGTPAPEPSVEPTPEPPPTSPPVEPPPTSPPVEPPPAPVPIDPEVRGVTTAAWHPHDRFDLHWQLLLLPERLIDLAFTPFGLVIDAADRYRLGKRLSDLLELFDRRLVLAPRFKFSFGDGAGAGLWIKRTRLFDERAELRLGGLVRLDRDWQVELQYRHALLLPDGRGLRARAFVERDKNQRFYGIGGDTLETDRRVLRSDDEGAVVEVDLQGIDRYTYSGVAAVGLRRQTLSPGVDAVYPPVGGAGDTVVPPPAFDQTALYLDLTLVGRYDTRDTVGRPVRGVFADISGRFRKDVTGKDLSAVTLHAGVSVHVPVIADHRTIILSLSGTAALPIQKDTMPLDALAVIGRSNVRGYDRERFRDRYGVVGSIEYRFPIWDYLNSRAGLDAFVFVDGGEVWGASDWSWNRLRYSLGGGFRVGHESRQVMQTTFGWSPEGYQVNLGVETEL